MILSKSHCARSASRQRTTLCAAGIGPISTISKPGALLVIQDGGPSRRLACRKPISIEANHPIALDLQEGDFVPDTVVQDH